MPKTLKQQAEEAEVIVCPICQRPKKQCSALRLLDGENGSKVKFAEEIEASAIVRSANLVAFHAPVCPTCRRSAEHCREVRIAAITKRMKAEETLQKNPFFDPNAVTKALATEPCKPQPFTGKPTLPEWWRPNQEEKAK